MTIKRKTDKEILIDNIRKKITTTMIGAIDAVEKKLGFLWSKDDADAKFMQKTFLEIRKNILDNGNAQIKLAEEEISGYDIEKTSFHTIFPVITQERLNKNG